MKLRHVRVPHVAALVVALLVLAGALFLWLSRNFQFYFDEWDFVLHQPQSASDYFGSHNGHWSTVPILVYQGMLHLVGMRSHIPFMGVVIALHLANSLLVFRLIRRSSGDLLALMAFAVLLFLGWGAEDFLWPFQIGFQGSVLFGLVAINLVGSRRFGWLTGAGAGAALLLAVASSGVGMAFVAAVGVEVLVDPTRRKRAFVVVPAILAVATWAVTVSPAELHATHNPLTTSDLTLLAHYVLFGIGAGGAAVAGVGTALGDGGVYAALVLVGVLFVAANPKRIDGRVMGALAGLLVEFGTAGLIRAQAYGYAEAGSRRYLYVAAIFVLLTLTAALAQVSWHQFAAPTLVVVEALAITGNLIVLMTSVTFWNGESATQDIELQTVNALRGQPGINLWVSPDPTVMPQVTVGALYMAEDRFGSPVRIVSLETLRRSRPELVETVLRALQGT